MNDGDLEGSDDNEQEDNLEEDAESGMDPALPRCSEVVKSCDIGLRDKFGFVFLFKSPPNKPFFFSPTLPVPLIMLAVLPNLPGLVPLLGGGTALACPHSPGDCLRPFWVKVVCIESSEPARDSRVSLFKLEELEARLD